MDVQYWEDYYDKHNEPFDPSDFARFALKYMNEGDTVLELGCGNGRDSIFFGGHGIHTIGLDQCENIVKTLNERGYENTKFLATDFTHSQEDYGHNHVYSRFTLHAISEEEAQQVLAHTRISLDGYFFIEVRSDKDSLVGAETDHFRRFENFETLLQRLIHLGYEIEYAEISKGFSKYDKKFDVDYNEDDPTLIRIVAKSY